MKDGIGSVGETSARSMRYARRQFDTAGLTLTPG
jgi:hypothetical protein